MRCNYHKSLCVADWNATGVPEYLYEDKSLTLPLVIQTFTPVPVAVIGMHIANSTSIFIKLPPRVEKS